MFAGIKIVVELPACNAEKTLRKAYDEIADQRVAFEERAGVVTMSHPDYQRTLRSVVM
jgi:hypothetical protein